jgi:hypothetical protein
MRLTSVVAVVCGGIVVSSGCDTVERARSRFGKTTTDTVVTSAGSGLALGLQAPPVLHPGDEGILRLSVTNQTDTVVSQVRLELTVPAWAQPGPPRVGDRPVTMTALETGSTQFSYRIDDAPLNPGQVQTVTQRIRIPAAGIEGRSTGPWTRTVTARLLALDGRTLSEVRTDLSLDSATMAASTTTDAAPPTRRERVGPAELGMSPAAVKQAAPNTRDTTWTQGGAQQHGLIVPVGDRSALALLTGNSVARIEVGHPAIQTAEHTGVGSRMDELRAAYGAPCAEVVAGRIVVRFAEAPGIAFALNTPAPRDAAQLDAGRIPGTAQVTRWWLSRDVEACAAGG